MKRISGCIGRKKIRSKFDIMLDMLLYNDFQKRFNLLLAKDLQ